MSINLSIDIFNPKQRFLSQRSLKKRGHQIVVNVEVIGTRIVYMLIASRPQSQKDLGF